MNKVNLGIDIGLATLGWSILEIKDKTFELVSAGAIFTDKYEKMEDRLEIIFSDINSLIETYSPSEIAVEDLFFFKNKKTIITVAQARGVVLLSAGIKKLKVFSYSPLEVKSAITGYGRADKRQVQEMVRRIFKLDSIPKPDDVADAIAINYCHFNNRQKI